MTFLRILTLATLASMLVACGDGGAKGALTITLGAEETIADGIASGDGDEDIADGWEIQYDKFIVSIGDIQIARAGSSAAASDMAVNVIDLVQIPPSGLELTSFDGLTAQRWDRVSYALVAPSSSSTRASSVSTSDFDAMVTGGCTYLISGTLTPAEGAPAISHPPGGVERTVPSSGIAFDFCVPAAVDFTNCESDGVPGIAIPSGGTANAELTFHGDHITFPSFNEGAESVTRRAQWLADCDTNGDNVLTRAELEGITGTNRVALFPSDVDPGTPGNQGYDLSGAPGGAITSAFGFLTAQLRTQGHLNGEGDCTWSVE